MELGEQQIEDLVEKAKEASKAAYCKYSNFSVGAAIITRSGSVFTGCNVENVSYGLTICAERNAVFSMVASKHYDIAAVVIYTPTPEPMASCGACLQVMSEFNPSVRVISTCDGPGRIDRSLSDLLPCAFRADLAAEDSVDQPEYHASRR